MLVLDRPHSNVAKPTRGIVEHGELEAVTGQRFHFARHAALAARPLIGEQRFKHSTKIIRDADCAKHTLPSAAASGGAPRPAAAPCGSVLLARSRWADADSDDADAPDPDPRGVDPLFAADPWALGSAAFARRPLVVAPLALCGLAPSPLGGPNPEDSIWGGGRAALRPSLPSSAPRPSTSTCSAPLSTPRPSTTTSRSAPSSLTRPPTSMCSAPPSASLPSTTSTRSAPPRRLDDFGDAPPMFTMVQKPVEVPQNVRIGQQEVCFASGLSDLLSQKLLSLSEILMSEIKKEAEIAKRSTLHLFDLFQQSKQSSHVCVLDCIQNVNGLAKIVQALDRKVDDVVNRLESLTNVLKPVEVPQLARFDQRVDGIASRSAFEPLESPAALPAPAVVPLAAGRGCSVPVSDEEDFSEVEYAEYYKRFLEGSSAPLASDAVVKLNSSSSSLPKHPAMLDLRSSDDVVLKPASSSSADSSCIS